MSQISEQTDGISSPEPNPNLQKHFNYGKINATKRTKAKTATPYKTNRCQVVLHPKCTECGVTTSFLQDFQKRLTGFLSNFVVDYMCDPCYERRNGVSNSNVEYLDEYINDISKSDIEPDTVPDNKAVSITNDSATEEPINDIDSPVKVPQETAVVAASSALDSTNEFLDEENNDTVASYDGYTSDESNYFGDSDNVFEAKYHGPESGIQDNGPEIKDNGPEIKEEAEIIIEDTDEIVRDKSKMYYFCMECLKLFSNLQFLKDHGNLLHNPYRTSKSIELPMKCSECEQSFGRENALEHHTQTEHNLFICIYCAKSCATKRELNEHETRVHYAERNELKPDETFKCLVCSYTYGVYIKLMLHVKNRHEDGDNVNHKPKRSLSPAKPNAFFYKIIKDEQRNCVLLLNGKDYAENFGQIIEKHATAKVQHHHCPKCTISFRTSDKLYDHLATFLHDICEHPPSTVAMTTEIKTERKADVNDGDSSKSKRYNCEYCPKLFTSIIMRDTHQHYKHNPETDTLIKSQYQCGMCQKWYGTKRRLSEHNLKYHRQARLASMRYECRICSKNFQSQKFRSMHERGVHQNAETKLYECKLCPETFRHPFNLQGHMNVHKELTPFVCEYCGRGFTMAKYLRTHRNRHTHEREFVCEICKKQFNYKSNLSSHMLTHSDLKVKKYPCNECDRSFADSRDIRRHRYQLHSNSEKEFACHMCSYEAYMRTDLHKHLRTIHLVYQTTEENNRVAHRSLKKAIMDR